MTDDSYVAQTLQKLVQINSVNPSLDSSGAGEAEIGQFIAGELAELGVDHKIDELAPGRINVIGTIPGRGSGRSLMFNAHTDTVGVAGMDNPFSGTINNGKLYGRGSYDMKGGIAAMLGAVKILIREKRQLEGDLVLSFVADEEYESLGAFDLVKKLKTDAAIVTEPTDLNICLAHRGFGIFKIVTKGKTAHGGNHRLGIDANSKMGTFLAELNDYSDQLPDNKKHSLCGEASIHVPLIEGGKSLFIYSDKCTIHAERRTLPGETEEGVTSELNQIIKKAEANDPEFKASLESLLWRSPYEIDRSSTIVKELTNASASVLGNLPGYIGHSWWEDSAIFGEAGIETVIMGPRGSGIHEETEWVDIASVVELSKILYETALLYCR